MEQISRLFSDKLLSLARRPVEQVTDAPRALLVCSLPETLERQRDFLQALSMTVRTAMSPGRALDIVNRHVIEICIVEWKLFGEKGADFIDKITARQPEIQIVALVESHDSEQELAALTGGAVYCLHLPLNFDEVGIITRRCRERLELRKQLQRSEQELAEAVREIQRAGNRQRRLEKKMNKWRSLSRDSDLEAASREIGVVHGDPEELRQYVAEITGELLESQEFLDSIVAAMPDGLLVFDSDRVVGFVNQAAGRILGFSQLELVVKRWTDFFPKNDDGLGNGESHSASEQFWQDLHAKPGVQNIETDLLHKEGRRIPVMLSGSVCYGADRQINGVVCILKDITLQKEMEQKAEQHREQLIQADKMIALGTLVSSVMHEINNPNNFIRLTLPSIKMAWDNLQPFLDSIYEDQGDFEVGALDYTELRELLPVAIHDVIQGADRIGAIVAEFKEYARPVRVNDEKFVDINLIVERAVKLIRHFIHRRTRFFEIVYGENIPQVQVSEQRVEQVVINLLRNSCEALDSDSQAVSVCTHYDPETNMSCITVRDQGSGIPPEAMDKLTNPFFTTKHDSGGMGLGLSICARIIKVHGGTLTFSSRQGEGTTAVIALPAAT